MESFFKASCFIVGFIAILFVASLIAAFPLMLIWNYAVVAALPTVAAPITFWVAYWLVILLALFRSPTSKKA